MQKNKLTDKKINKALNNTFINNFKNHFNNIIKNQLGFTLMEMMVILSILAITASLGSWYFFRTQDSTDLKSYTTSLSQSMDAAQDYYAGNNNPNVTGTFQGFDVDTAQELAPDFLWLAEANCNNDEINNICIIPSTTSDTIVAELTLCNYYGEGFFCLKDDLGTRFWGSGENLDNAKQNLQDNITNNVSCSTEANRIVNQALNNHTCQAD